MKSLKNVKTSIVFEIFLNRRKIMKIQGLVSYVKRLALVSIFAIWSTNAFAYVITEATFGMSHLNPTGF